MIEHFVMTGQLLEVALETIVFSVLWLIEVVVSNLLIRFVKRRLGQQRNGALTVENRGTTLASVCDLSSNVHRLGVIKEALALTLAVLVTPELQDQVP